MHLHVSPSASCLSAMSLAAPFLLTMAPPSATLSFHDIMIPLNSKSSLCCVWLWSGILSHREGKRLQQYVSWRIFRRSVIASLRLPCFLSSPKKSKDSLIHLTLKIRPGSKAAVGHGRNHSLKACVFLEVPHRCWAGWHFRLEWLPAGRCCLGDS